MSPMCTPFAPSMHPSRTLFAPCVPAAASSSMAPPSTHSISLCPGLCRGSPTRQGVLGTVGDGPWVPSPRSEQAPGAGGGFGWEARVSGAAGWAPRRAAAACPWYVGTPLASQESVRLIPSDVCGGNRAFLGEHPGTRRWLCKPLSARGRGTPGRCRTTGMAGDRVFASRSVWSCRASPPGPVPVVGQGRALCQTPRHQLLRFPTGKTHWGFYSSGLRPP